MALAFSVVWRNGAHIVRAFTQLVVTLHATRSMTEFRRRGPPLATWAFRSILLGPFRGLELTGAASKKENLTIEAWPSPRPHLNFAKRAVIFEFIKVKPHAW